MRTFLLVVHISSGSLALLAGPVAMLLPKKPGWHPRLGRAYQALVALLCVSAVGLVVLQPALWWLGIVAGATWAAALAGWQARRLQRPGWLPWHISLMCGSYISLLTALLVVNLGLGDPVAWALPTIVGSPLIARAAYRAAIRGNDVVASARPDKIVSDFSFETVAQSGLNQPREQPFGMTSR